MNTVFSKAFDVIDTHTEGEPTRIMFWNEPIGKYKNALELRENFKREHDNVRKLLMLEPRGHIDQFGAIIFPPISEENDYTLLYITNDGYLDMCGHATIGVSTVLASLGYVKVSEPETVIRYDTVSGNVEAHVHINNNNVESVSIIDVNSYYVGNGNIDIEGKRIRVDIAYGGNYYAIVNSKDIKIPVETENIENLISTGNEIRKQTYHIIKDMVPDNGENLYPLAMITDDKKEYRAVVIFSNKSFDRSPCGTGTAARAALLHEKGILKEGDSYVHRSIIGSQFQCKIISVKREGNKNLIIPEITGSAWITQFTKIVVSPDDPFQSGFMPKK
ncbi:proline racemase family protein [Oxyplasma meridianum]|uniref:Proline racemase family protein n=1 Tax=Oxyplasma meridianum TaxID=3073602 RepID=A0AAX4NDJ6_9ARCH